jgi:hypothetical protein
MLNVLERILQSRPQAYANTSADFEVSPKFDRPQTNKPNRGRRRRRKTVNLEATSRETESEGYSKNIFLLVFSTIPNF